MIRQRAFLVRNRHRIALMGFIAVLAVLLAFEHSGIGHERFDDVASMCLAVVDASLLAIGGGLLVRSLRRPRAPKTLGAQRRLAPLRAPASATGHMARAGPYMLQVIQR